jgi:hypothetical protein
MGCLWYCCRCNFGPHNSSLYSACIQCGTARCHRCTDQKISDNMNVHSHSHSYDPTSAYPDAVPMSSPRTPTFTSTTTSIVVPELPGVRPLPRADCTYVPPASLAGTKSHGTYMYICCQCNDGPKIYDHQPKCVVCNHTACGNCISVK